MSTIGWIIIIIILLILYFIYINNPYVFPSFLWHNKYCKRFNNFQSKLVEHFTGINVSDTQLNAFYDKFTEKLGNKKIVMLHYTSWCPYCQKMKPVWESVKQSYTGEILMIENDEEKSPTPTITGYPTIILHANGKNIKYSGNADRQSLMDFIKSNE